MKVLLNQNFYKEGFNHSSIGARPSQEITGLNFLKEVKVDAYRLGQLLYCFDTLAVRTSSNILAYCKDYFQPCTVEELQGVLKFKDKRTFKAFLDSLSGCNILKVQYGNIYINPLFTMSYEIDYIRDELFLLFPEYTEEFIKINKVLLENFTEEIE